MPNKLKITPHEPGQPLVGAEESFEDAKLLLRLLEEKRERVRKAKQKLREMSMTVLDEKELRRRKVVVEKVLSVSRDISGVTAAELVRAGRER